MLKRKNSYGFVGWKLEELVDSMALSDKLTTQNRPIGWSCLDNLEVAYLRETSCDVSLEPGIRAKWLRIIYNLIWEGYQFPVDYMFILEVEPIGCTVDWYL